MGPGWVQEFLFLGDTRMRHHFLATVAYFRGANLRGYANPAHPHFYGQANLDHWHPPGPARSFQRGESIFGWRRSRVTMAVSYTHLRAHETEADL
eukprot:1008821-Rhodomonas_salina.1